MRVRPAILDAALRGDNARLLGKLAVVAALMFGFGYALVPMYRSICEALGINVLSLAERAVPGGSRATARTRRSTRAAPSPSSSTPTRAGRSSSSRRSARSRSTRAS